MRAVTAALALARRLVVPSLDLRPGRDADAAWAEAERRLDAGAGGLILFGGEREELARRLPALRRRLGRPFLVGADLERGVAQQVRGALDLPPAMALGAADEAGLAERAGGALAAEALALGIDWVLGPVLDLADEPRNPIVGARAFAADPARVARLGAAFVRGVQAQGALACAKHFPGHGGTLADSHDALPVVERDAATLHARDLSPFRHAVEAGVATLMTAHVVFPALSPTGAPATLDPVLVDGLLRAEWGYEGLVVTDALIMAGVQQGLAEAEAAVAAVRAGCDLLLYPSDPDAVAARLAAWAEEDPAHRARLERSCARLEAALARDLATPTAPPPDPAPELAQRALTREGPARPAIRPGDDVALLLCDDDDLPGFGHALCAALAAAGVRVRPAALRNDPSPAATERARAALATGARVVAAVGCRVRAWKGRAGLGPSLAARLRALPGERTTVVGLCGPLALQDALPEGAEVLWAYGDEACCQRAAAAALLGAPAPGRRPVP
ncbi:MAG: hypothetical protein D6731_09900 [Planctomycetota bacterium]|nr:MAG: hypothetical protein D6731_09900 [Planctomycetota bacterium]